MRMVRFLIGLLCICLPLSLSAANTSAQLKSLKKIYEDGLERALGTDQAGGMSDVESAYVRELGELQKVRQAAGDLDGLMAAKQESSRFRAERTLSVDHLVESPAELRALQQKHMDAVAGAPLTRAKAVVDWTSRYVAKLTSMKTDYTRRGKIDAALSMNSEIKRVEDSDPVRQARDLLAAESAPGDQDIAAENGRLVEAPGGDAPGGRDPVERIGESVIYWKERPAAGDLRYRSVTLRNTANARLKRDVSVTAQSATSSSSQRSVETGEDSVSSSKAVEKETYLRLALRAPRGTGNLGMLRLVVQYFGRPVNSERGKGAEPEEIQREALPLRRSLGGDIVTVDLPPLRTGTRSSSYTSVWSDGGGSKHERGMDFYGLVVSLFAEDGSFVYQSTSVSALEEMAQGALPALAKLKADMAAARARVDEIYAPFIEARKRYWANEGNPDIAADYRSKRVTYESAAADHNRAREAYLSAGGLIPEDE